MTFLSAASPLLRKSGSWRRIQHRELTEAERNDVSPLPGNVFGQPPFRQRRLEALVKRLLTHITGAPELLHGKMPQDIGQAADVIELRVRRNDIVNRLDPAVP